jgi:TetR/AcrR family transcriptional repressor of mexJK operon
MAKTAKRNSGRISVGDRRREAMVQAAYSLFMDRGYESVSVDDIIRLAGGSKASLYKFFGNKEGILRAVVETLADEMLREFNVEFPSGHTVRESLLHIGTVLADLALSENAISQHRHAVAHSRAFPGVARLWYETGPSRSIQGIAAFLERETEAGRLQVDDPVRAAWLFGGMILFKNNMRLLIGAPAEKKTEIKKTVTEAVDAFLAAYGA